MMKRVGELPHDADAEWWVNSMSGDLGARGTMGSVVSVLERGGPSASSQTNPDHMDDRHMLAVHRWRRVNAYWRRLSAADRDALTLYYEHRQFPRGAREELGALAALALEDKTDEHLLDACRKLHERPTSWRTTQPGAAALQVVTASRERARAVAVAAHTALAVAREAAADALVNA
ncbi:MAG TPA: hypothetical protein VMW48_08460 [Vicinamibacterales bacterium]|nr:hypothetical protein [Vicinamibacterales bacterium]